MIYIAGYIMLLSVLQWFISLVNFIFNPVIKVSEVKFGPLISVLIPARNEEKNIKNIILDLLNQQYKNIEIIIFDDQSEDQTARVVRGYIKHHGNIKLISSKGLPVGWQGKNYGSYILAKNANGSFYLFLDADVRLNDGFIQGLLHDAKKNNLSLLTIFPKQIMKTQDEKRVVPIMNRILLSLLPLILVRRSGFKSLSAANGQCMFFESKAYEKIQPHLIVKGNWIEDIAIARLMKKCGLKIDCKMGNELITCRMYENYQDAIDGFSKNIAAFFGNSLILAFIYALCMILGFVMVVVYLPMYMLGIYFLLNIMRLVFISRISRQSFLDNLLYHFHQQFSLITIIINAFRKRNNKTLLWKGRSIVNYS